MTRPEGAKGVEERVRAMAVSMAAYGLFVRDDFGKPNQHAIAEIATLCVEYAREQVGISDKEHYAKFSESRDKVLAELDTAQAQLQTLRGENERLRGDLDAYYAENGKLKEEADDRSSAISKYISVHQHQKESIAALTQEKAALEAEIARLRNRP